MWVSYKKALEIHTCNTCKSFGKQCETFDINNLLTRFKAYSNDKNTYGNLQSPPEDFINFIYKLELVFNSQFEDISTGPAVSNILFNIMENIHFTHPCLQFPIIYVKKLFIRMKIFYTIEYTNRDLNLTKSDKKAQRKLKILSHL